MSHENLSITLASLAETERLAAVLATRLPAGSLVLLDGQLGAGKTAFAKALVHALGVPESVMVTSPTFSLLNEYHVVRAGMAQAYKHQTTIVHGDTYRLSDPAELIELGLLDALDEGAIGIVEWGSRLIPYLDRDRLCLCFSVLGSDSRQVELQAVGRWAEEAMASLTAQFRP